MDVYSEQRPWGAFYQYVHNEPAEAKVVTLEKKATHHETAERDVFIEVLIGEGTLHMNGEDTRITNGTRLDIPAGAEYSVEAADEELRFLHILLGGDGDPVNVKILVVKKESSLSLQYHKLRSEMWEVVDGEGIMTLDDKQFTVTRGDIINIEQGMHHRVSTEDKDFRCMEVASGHFDENDNIRLEDQYGRDSPTMD